MDEIKGRYQAGSPFVVRFGEPKVLHTSEQRGYYWTVLKAFGAELGMNAKESEAFIHNECKCRAFGVSKTVRFGGTVREVPNASSADAGKDEYSRLIDELIILAGEHGYTIPPPESA